MELFIILSLVTRRFDKHNLDPSAICQLGRDNVFLSDWRLTVKIIKNVVKSLSLHLDKVFTRRGKGSQDHLRMNVTQATKQSS